MTRSPNRTFSAAAALGSALLLGGCVAPPIVRDYESRVPPPAVAPPPPAIYPARGQSDEQLRRDRFECYRWAADQSRFDPARSLARLPPPPPPRVEPVPPSGAGTATGVIAGAALGAAVSNTHHSAEGAAVGALLGGIVGAASDAAREAEARRIEGELAAQAARAPRLDGRAEAYRRAFAACLEGRGYSVR